MKKTFDEKKYDLVNGIKISKNLEPELKERLERGIKRDHELFNKLNEEYKHGERGRRPKTLYTYYDHHLMGSSYDTPPNPFVPLCLFEGDYTLKELIAYFNELESYQLSKATQTLSGYRKNRGVGLIVTEEWDDAVKPVLEKVLSPSDEIIPYKHFTPGLVVLRKTKIDESTGELTYTVTKGRVKIDTSFPADLNRLVNEGVLEDKFSDLLYEIKDKEILPTFFPDRYLVSSSKYVEILHLGDFRIEELDFEKYKRYFRA